MQDYVKYLTWTFEDWCFNTLSGIQLLSKETVFLLLYVNGNFGRDILKLSKRSDLPTVSVIYLKSTIREVKVNNLQLGGASLLLSLTEDGGRPFGLGESPHHTPASSR